MGRQRPHVPPRRGPDLHRQPRGRTRRSDGEVVNVTATGNRGIFGGAIAIQGGTLDGCTIEGNFAVEGGGLHGYYDSVRDCDSAGNAGVWGGGAWVPDGSDQGSQLERGTLTSITTDWGEGTSENTPDDMAGVGFSTAAYGADASFTCDGTTGSCE